MKKIIIWAVIICVACGAGVLGWYHLFKKPKTYINCYNQALDNMLYGKNGAWDNVKITTTAPETAVDFDGGIAEIQIYTSETNRFALKTNKYPTSSPNYYFYFSGLTDAKFDKYTLDTLTSLKSKDSSNNTFTNEAKTDVYSIIMGLESIEKYDSVKDLGNNIFEISYSKNESGEVGEFTIKYLVKVQRGKTAEESKLLEINTETNGKWFIDGREVAVYEAINVIFSYGAVDANEMARLYQLAQAYQG